MKRIILVLVLTLTSVMSLELGNIPTKVTLAGENGAKVDGTSWSSSMLHGKVHIVFYVDPDKKDLNNALSERLKAKKFDRKKFNSVAIINLAATWLPNVLIASSLEKKQKKFPHTIYVKDKKKVLVDQWKLADDNSDILLFDKKGKLIYKKFGKLNALEIKKVISLIEENM